MPLLGDGLLHRGNLYLLRDEFTTAESAPIASPRTCEPGPGTLTVYQVDGQYSIVAGDLVIPAQASPNWGDQGFNGVSGVPRAAGLALIVSVNISTLDIGSFVAWATAATATIYAGANTADNAMSLLYVASVAGLYITESSGTSATGAALFTLSAATQYQFALVLRGAGGYVFVKGGAFADWTLIFVCSVENTATLYPVFSNYGNVGTMQRIALRQAGGLFETDAIHTLSQANPSGTYSAVADGIFHLRVTAPGILAGSVHLKYRYQDANNYWDLYLDSVGTLRLDSVLAGVPTNRIIAAGVALAGQNYTLEVRAVGTKHYVYVLAGTQITRYGAEVNVSHLDAVTDIDVSASNYTADQVSVWPNTSANYSALDGI